MKKNYSEESVSIFLNSFFVHHHRGKLTRVNVYVIVILIY